MYKVVLVDDESWALKGIENSFNWRKHNCIVAFESESPKTTLQFIIDNKPDIVFSDIRMPEMTGIELLEAIREKQRNCEFVIVSAFADFSYAKCALDYGAFGYLLKPIETSEADELLARVVKKLDSKKDSILSDAANDAHEQFYEILLYIQNTFHKNIKLSDVADKFFISPSYLSVLFKKKTGYNFIHYLTKLKMERAKELLVSTNYDVTVIAKMLGYSNVSYFSQVYKSYFGFQPTMSR